MAKPGRVLPSHRRNVLQTAFVLLIVSALVRASPTHDVVPENDFVELPEQVASMAETQVASGEETNAEATTVAAAAWTAEQAEVTSSKATKESGSPKEQPDLNEIKAEAKTSTAEIPCMVIAGTRNGARYPEAAKNWPNQAAWPRASSKFWSENAGQLTIQGGEQMERVGAKMASIYPQMFEFVHSLKIFSDSDTLRSATHFLKGAMGGTTPSTKVVDIDDAIGSDDLLTDYNLTESDAYRQWEAQQPGDDYAVLVHLIDSLIHDPQDMYPLQAPASDGTIEDLHFEDWQTTQIDTWCETHTVTEEAYITELVNMTGQSADNCQDWVRLIQTFYAQMVIDRNIGLKPFPNFVGLNALTGAEQTRLKSATDSIAHMFYGGASGTVHGSAARWFGAIGHVIADSVERMQGHLQTGNGCNAPKFVLFQGHDSSIMQMFALLGIQMPIWPSFSSYWTIEIYQGHVKFCYNLDAESNPDAEPECLGLEKSTVNEEAATVMKTPAEIPKDVGIDTMWFLRSLDSYWLDFRLSSKEAYIAGIVHDTIFANHGVDANANPNMYA